jgi:hypothetical protein
MRGDYCSLAKAVSARRRLGEGDSDDADLRCSVCGRKLTTRRSVQLETTP